MSDRAVSTTIDLREAVCPQRATGLADSPPLDGEVVVVDLTTDRVYAFNAALSEIWAACDGVTKVESVARRIADKFGLPEDQAIVEDALRALRRHRLVGAERETRRPVRINRRELGRRVRRAVPAALALPAITSILLEQPASAAVFSLPCIRDTVCAAGLGVCGQRCFASGAAARDCPTKACLRSLSGTGSISCKPIGTGGCPGGGAAPATSTRQAPPILFRRR